MKHGLAIFLGYPFLGLDDSEHVVIEFPSKEDAEVAAVKMIRATGWADGKEIKAEEARLGRKATDAEILEWFQDACGSSEYFHIYPIFGPHFVKLATMATA